MYVSKDTCDFYWLIDYSDYEKQKGREQSVPTLKHYSLPFCTLLFIISLSLQEILEISVMIFELLFLTYLILHELTI